MKNIVYILLFLILLTLPGCTTPSPKETKKTGPYPESPAAKRTPEIEQLKLARQFQQRGEGSLKDKEYEEALKLFLKAKKIRPDSDELLFDIGLTLRHLNRHEEALIYFHKALAINPRSYQSLRNIGIIKREKEQYSESVKDFLKALEIKPDDRDSIVNLADMYFTAGEYELCHKYIAMFYESLDHLPQDEHQTVSNIFKRFDAYMTVIIKERRKQKLKEDIK
jgi:tetratricopeptide (TPR) repeat protein